jgi:DNA-binding NarL/FixJ family response regulator
MKILIADDHTIVREGLKRILLEAFPFCEIHDVSNSVDLLKKALHESWDIIISDITMAGQSISKIGETLSLSVNTISTYRTRIMEKLNMHNNADLVKYVMKHSLI